MSLGKWNSYSLGEDLVMVMLIANSVFHIRGKTPYSYNLMKMHFLCTELSISNCNLTQNN